MQLTYHMSPADLSCTYETSLNSDRNVQNLSILNNVRNVDDDSATTNIGNKYDTKYGDLVVLT